MPKRTSKTGGELFIVDNSDDDWKEQVCGLIRLQFLKRFGRQSTAGRRGRHVVPRPRAAQGGSKNSLKRSRDAPRRRTISAS